MLSLLCGIGVGCDGAEWARRSCSVLLDLWETCEMGLWVWLSWM